MKRLLIKLFFKEKFIGQLSAAIAAALIGWLFSTLPNSESIVTKLVGFFVELPQGEVVTQSTVIAVVASFFVWLINAVVQNYIAKDNNEVLETLKAEGVYPGPLDSWVGPKAQDGLNRIIDSVSDRFGHG